MELEYKGKKIQFKDTFDIEDFEIIGFPPVTMFEDPKNNPKMDFSGIPPVKDEKIVGSKDPKVPEISKKDIEGLQSLVPYIARYLTRMSRNAINFIHEPFVDVMDFIGKNNIMDMFAKSMGTISLGK
jgi:hypothetical protein